MNKFIFFFLFEVLHSFNINAQNFQGVILDKESKSPLPYANIGIIGKNIGTVSNENGQFSLKGSDISMSDTLKISYIGYESALMTKIVVDSLIKQVIELNPKNIVLKEIIVQSTEFKKEVILGNTVKWDNITFSFLSNQYGTEIGTYIKLRKRAKLEELRFNIVKSEYDSLVFRVNIYDFVAKYPKNSLLEEPIFVRPENKKGIAIIDLTKYNILLDNDFFISLEYFKPLGQEGKKIFISAGLMNSPSYYRLGSQGTWYKLKSKGFVIGLGLHVKVKREK